MARRKGYRSYYEYRTLFDSGRIKPTDKPLPKGQRSRTRGHVGETARFLRFLKPGFIISLVDPIAAIDTYVPTRGPRKGVQVFRLIHKLVIDNRGDARQFKLRNLTRPELVAVIREEIRKGAVFTPAPSLDQRALVNRSELGEV
jgi:hypothetical protein